MKKNLLIAVCLILTACSSTPTTRKFASDETLKLDDDYNWVETLDFDKKTETKYKAENDEFNPTKETEASVLVKESISSVPTAKLEEQIKESDDPLSKIVIRCNQNKFEEAFVIIDQIYSQFKNNTSYWNQVASCYYLKGDHSKAILFYNKSRDLDPKFSPPVNNLGVVFQSQGRFQKALAAYKKANDMNAFSVTPAFNLARLYLQFGVVSKAEPIIKGLNKKSPTDNQVTASMAMIYLLKNDYQLAANLYQTLPKEILSKAEVGLNYAVALKLLNKKEEASNVFSAIQDSNGELKSYAKKVESFIKE